MLASLQRHNTENWKQIFPEKELRGLSPNLYIHVSVSDLYIPTFGLPILLQKNMWNDPWEYINPSQTNECRNGTVPFLGTHKWDFRCTVGTLPLRTSLICAQHSAFT